MTNGPDSRGADVVLRDGGTVRIRPARTTDRAKVEDYLIGLSPEARRLRFLSDSIDVTEVAATAINVEPGAHVTLLALTGGDDGTVIGGAQYFRTTGGRAEVGVSVADAFQGRGLGSILIGRLAQAAHLSGIETLVAEVLPENHRMIDVFRQSGFAPRIRALPGTIEVTFPTTFTDDAVRSFEERADAAAASAVRTFLSPEVVAVIGASRNATSIGGRLFRSLLLSGFRGVVHPVNTTAAAVQGVAAFPSVLDIPQRIDVAFVAVPAEHVATVARQCAEKGVRGLVVITSGFAETSGEGPARERELIEICSDAGMRLIGPNCMGIVNTDPEVGLFGTFASATPAVGNVAFLSQSGALGLAVMNQTAGMSLGLSAFVSVGNKADISGNDLLAFWESDPRTDVILLYLESFGNPRRFARLARRVADRKPIVAVKSGRSAAGARAASSHTGAMLASSDVAVDSLFRQSGVIRTDTLAEMLDVAALLANQPLPRGRRVGIITNAGGLAILCADAAEARDLSVPAFSEETAARLRSFLPSEASVTNPVDMIASADGADYARAIDAVAGSGEVDSIVLIYIPPLESQAPEIARHVAEAVTALERRVPVLTVFMTTSDVADRLRSSPARIPVYAFPEQAVIALARAADYGGWRERPTGSAPAFADVGSDEAAGIISSALAEGHEWLEPGEIESLLGCYGIRMPRAERVKDAAGAGEATERIGGPVALKAVGPLHKTEAGAVRLGLRGPEEVAGEAARMTERLTSAGLTMEGFLVQQMVPDGVEMLVGVTSDPLFGPVVACGAGGTLVELLHDVEVRLAPLTDVDAREMVGSLRTFPLLDGFRGAPKADVAALEELVLRVGAMADSHPEIVEMDCNPVMVLPRGVMVVDARIRVQVAPAPQPIAVP